MTKILVATNVALLCAILCGCQPTTPPATQASSPTPPAAPPAQAQPAQNPTSQPPKDQTAVEAQPQKAQVGVAKQGRSLDNEKGVGRMIAQPVISLLAFREKAVFTIQIPQALQLFEASEGRKPKSHQEFMDKIIKANNIQLPALQAGQEYNFHVDTGDLWVHPIEVKK